jgi:hypothetical protein
MNIIFDDFGWDKMKDDFVKIYIDIYSIEELKAIVGFFKSPVGQSMLTKQPLLIKKTLV